MIFRRYMKISRFNIGMHDTTSMTMRNCIHQLSRQFQCDIGWQRLLIK